MLRKNMFVFYSFLLFTFICVPVQAQKDSSLDVVKKYIEHLNHNNWSAIPDLWVKDQKEDLIDFIKNKENQINKIGLFNIKTAKLVKSKEPPYKYAENYLPIRYMQKFKNPKVFYVGVDYNVHKEDQFHINGINYFFVVVALENSKWKIVLTPHVPVTSIINDGYGFGTDDEKTFDKRRQKFLN